jgi:hypothetical protein
VRDPIAASSRHNPLWGAERIRGELLKLVQQLNTLAATTETMEQDGETADLLATVQRDVNLHAQIAEAGGNVYLRDAFRRVAGPTMRLMYFA